MEELWVQLALGWLKYNREDSFNTRRLAQTSTQTGPRLGGDWNHSLEGSETAGSHDGRAMILAALEELDLWAPTAPLHHRLSGVKSIDHVAVSRHSSNPKAMRLPAFRDGKKLSDHDAYVVDID